MPVFFEYAVGFEPTDGGVAALCVRPLHHAYLYVNELVETPGADPGPMDFQSIAMTASAKSPFFRVRYGTQTHVVGIGIPYSIQLN